MKLPPLPEGNEGSIHHSKNPRAWNRHLTSCNWLRRRPRIGVGMLFRLGVTPMQILAERTAQHKPKNRPPAIPGGVHMIPPLAAVSVLAAFIMKLITWRDLCTWVALWEIRTWRDTRDPAHRNIFRFSTSRVAQALGRRRAGSHLKKSLAQLHHLGLAHLSPTEISFAECLDALPPELQTETKRILRVLGNTNSSRAIRMPRRLMRHILKSPRPRPVRAAVIFGMLLRIMMIKRNGWYKGCLTTALLVEVSGFNESRIKHERASLVPEGFFERLETPARVRQQRGNWYALGHAFPVLLDLHKGLKPQPTRAPNRPARQPPFRKPAPSEGIERNQFLASRLGASRSPSNQGPPGEPNWNRIAPDDMRQPHRRAALFADACRQSAIGNNPAEKLWFYAAIARATRLGNINPCGFLRRIVESKTCSGFIADCDEDQARGWLAAECSPDLDPAAARDVLRRISQPPAGGERPCQTGKDNATLPPVTEHLPDFLIVQHLAHSLKQAGFPTRNAFDLIMTTHEGRTRLPGWTRARWDKASNGWIPDSDRRLPHPLSGRSS